MGLLVTVMLAVILLTLPPQKLYSRLIGAITVENYPRTKMGPAESVKQRTEVRGSLAHG